MAGRRHLAVRCHSSFTVSGSELGIGVHNQGLLPPGVCAKQVQKSDEAAGS